MLSSAAGLVNRCNSLTVEVENNCLACGNLNFSSYYDRKIVCVVCKSSLKLCKSCYLNSSGSRLANGTVSLKLISVCYVVGSEVLSIFAIECTTGNVYVTTGIYIVVAILVSICTAGNIIGRTTLCANTTYECTAGNFIDCSVLSIKKIAGRCIYYINCKFTAININCGSTCSHNSGVTAIIVVKTTAIDSNVRIPSINGMTTGIAVSDITIVDGKSSTGVINTICNGCTGRSTASCRADSHRCTGLVIKRITTYGSKGTAIDINHAVIEDCSAAICTLSIVDTTFNGHSAMVVNTTSRNRTVTLGILKSKSTIVIKSIRSSENAIFHSNSLTVEVENNCLTCGNLNHRSYYDRKIVCVVCKSSLKLCKSSYVNLSLGRNVVGIFLTALTLTFYEVVCMRSLNGYVNCCACKSNGYGAAGGSYRVGLVSTGICSTPIVVASNLELICTCCNVGVNLSVNTVSKGHIVSSVAGIPLCSKMCARTCNCEGCLNITSCAKVSGIECVTESGNYGVAAINTLLCCCTSSCRTQICMRTCRAVCAPCSCALIPSTFLNCITVGSSVVNKVRSLIPLVVPIIS